MLDKLIHRQGAGDRRELAALLRQSPFDTRDDEPDRYARQRRIYDQLALLNQWAGTGSALIADRQRLFNALAFAATVSPPLFNVAQAHYGVCLTSIRTLSRPSAEIDRVIADLDSLSSVAAILITEVGVACSHLAVATRADYDAATDQFILNTPNAAACKIMANVALDGVAKTGVVFAQLWIGEHHHGLFPFVVPIRTREHTCEGVHVKALPGSSSLELDYSLVSFTEVRVPRAHWLQDTATLDAQGHFHDPLGGADKRLVRSLAAGANASTATAVGVSAAARACVWTTLRYAQQRKTGARLGVDRVVLQFRNQQSLLFSALAETFVISRLAQRLVDGDIGESAASGIATVPWAAINRIGALSKAVTVAGAAEVIRNCRRASGAHGCLGANRFGSYEDLTDAYSSAGGDNQLILIEIGRELASKPLEINSVGALPDVLQGADSLRQLARFEETSQYERATHGISTVKGSEETFFSVWNPRLPAILDLAKTYGSRIALDSFLDNLPAGQDGEAALALATIYTVEHFGRALSHATRDTALAHAFDVVMQHLDALLDAFELSPDIVGAPMAQDDYVSAYVRDLPLNVSA